MQNSRSPKGHKLLQFRDKLAKLNGHSITTAEKQKLQQISHQNKKVESQISKIFDSISEYYFKSESKILSISKQFIQHVQLTQKTLIRQLETLKQKQLDEIKEDVDHYLRFKKKTKKLIDSLQLMKGYDDQLAQAIHKLKPFSTQSIQQKISQCQFHITHIDSKIQDFNNLLQKIVRQTHKDNENKNQNPNFVKLLQSSSSLSPKSSSSEPKKHTNAETSKSKYFHWPTQANNKQKQQSERQDMQENLMEQFNDMGHQIQPIRKKLKYEKVEKGKQIDEKTEKNLNLSSMSNKNKLKKQTCPTAITSSLKSNMEKFLVELRKKQDKYQNMEIEAKIQEIREQKIQKMPFISRVKSQQNLRLRRTRQSAENIQTSLQQGTKFPILQNASSTAINLSPNNLRQSKSSKRCNWTSILKQQQMKYNQMRKKLKT